MGRYSQARRRGGAPTAPLGLPPFPDIDWDLHYGATDLDWAAEVLDWHDFLTVEFRWTINGGAPVTAFVEWPDFYADSGNDADELSVQVRAVTALHEPLTDFSAPKLLTLHSP